MQRTFCFPRRLTFRIILWRIVLLIAALVTVTPFQSVALAEQAHDAAQFAPLGTVNAPAAGGDITGLITADGGNDNIILNGGNYTITLPQNAPMAQAAPELPSVPTTTYNGVISGTGTITVRESGRALVLSNTSTYSLPKSQLHEYADEEPCDPFVYDGVVLHGGDCHSHALVLHGHNVPVLFINQGVTVHFDNMRNPSVFAVIRSAATATATPDPTSVRYNFDNIENHGTVVITNAANDPVGTVFGQISGSGRLINHVGGFALSGPSTYTGPSVLYSANIDDNTISGSLPNSRSIYNAFVLAYATPPKTHATAADINSGHPETSPGYLVVPQNIYEDRYGNSIHNISFGTIIFKGVYHYTDSGDPLNPSLGNPDLDYADCRGGNPTDRRLFLGHAAGITQLGDGTTAQMFLPASPKNGYIWLDRMQGLSFDYNGTVTLNVPINSADGGGIFTPGVRPGNVFILGTPGNHVIFTQPEYYNGLTKIDTSAILQLGDGTVGNDNPHFVYTSPKTGKTYQCDYSTSGGNGSLTTVNSAGGDATDQIINNGQLIVDNVPNALNEVTDVSLSNMSGSGSLVQEGTQPLTLHANTTYTGATTISNGTLVLASDASINSSSGVHLTNSGTTFDISQAGNQTIQDLSGADGSRIVLGKNTLIVGTTQNTTFAGTISNSGKSGGLTKVGQGTLTLTGKATTTNGNWQIQQGTLKVGDAAHAQTTLQGTLNVLDGATLSGRGMITGPVTNAGIVVPGDAGGVLTITGSYTQVAKSGKLAITFNGTQNGQLNVSGKVTLGGMLNVTPNGKLNVGNTFTILNNTGTDPIVGTFASLPEGATFIANGVTFHVSYVGGTGNDVVLTVAGGSNSITLTHTSPLIERSGQEGSSVSAVSLIGIVLAIVGLLVLAGALILALRLYRQWRNTLSH